MWYCALFIDDCFWRDILSLTWDFRSFHGTHAIKCTLYTPNNENIQIGVLKVLFLASFLGLFLMNSTIVSVMTNLLWMILESLEVRINRMRFPFSSGRGYESENTFTFTNLSNLKLKYA
jgi:hypothetical protein